MSMLIVMFRLRPGTDRAAYEAWARNTDLPVVRGLDSVAGFDLHRIHGLFGSEDRAPYEYVEVIEIGDEQRFGDELATATMQRVAAEFRAFADAPVFMRASRISGEE